MLPGFRFLFATVVLSVSILVFGLGAAALLRAAHEEFVSLPSWRLAQQPLLAPQFEMSAPTLAMLRIEAPAPKSMVETTKPQPQRLDALRPEAIRTDTTFTLPEAKPAEPAAPVDNAQAEPSSAATEPVTDAPASESAATLNAQASIDTLRADRSAMDGKASDESLATPATEAASTEAHEPETKQAAAHSTETEASEHPETVLSSARSSEATAAVTLPQPVVKKTTRVNTRAIARRRAIARARARAAERARAVLQQRQHNPDPFTQIFNGGAPRQG